jgi:antitoxin HicB
LLKRVEVWCFHIYEIINNRRETLEKTERHTVTILLGDKVAESLISLEIGSLPEGGYLATSADLPGLVAQGRTIAECVEIAQDVARKLVESYLERGDP